MDSNEIELSPHAANIQHGLALANRAMMERAAALNHTLIEGCPDGSFEERSARKLLGQAKRSGWWKLHFSEKENDAEKEEKKDE